MLMQICIKSLMVGSAPEYEGVGLSSQAGSLQDWTHQFEGIVALQTAVPHELPMRTGGGTVIAFHHHFNPGFPAVAASFDIGQLYPSISIANLRLKV